MRVSPLRGGTTSACPGAANVDDRGALGSTHVRTHTSSMGDVFQDLGGERQQWPSIDMVGYRRIG